MRALVCNSGCANACTGERGERDARATARQAAALLGIAPAEVIVASTGVIGVPLPVDRVQRGLERAAAQLESGGKAALDAGRGDHDDRSRSEAGGVCILLSRPQICRRRHRERLGYDRSQHGHDAGFLATDYPLGAPTLADLLREACEESFNMISVDGDMSTNDAVYAFAPASSNGALVPHECAIALRAVCLDLARAMVADGEGATKTLEVRVSSARDTPQARTIARAILNSNLVKTALYGEDPNWGRIVAAAGAARAGLDPLRWSLKLNGKPWVERGGIELLSEAEAHRELEPATVAVELKLGLGDAEATGWGCDLSRDYVRINASYRT